MTGDKLLQGIEATRAINDKVLELSKIDENVDDCKEIQGNLEIIVDILQEYFMDMVKMDALVEQIKEMNDKLENHLNKNNL